MAICWKKSVGPRFSEGARLAWLELDKRGWNQSRLAKELGEPYSTSHVSRYLYGERSPCREAACRFFDVLGVPIPTWSEKPKELFEPPAARAA